MEIMAVITATTITITIAMPEIIDNNSGNKGDNGNADQRTVKATKTGDTTNFATVWNGNGQQPEQ